MFLLTCSLELIPLFVRPPRRHQLSSSDPPIEGGTVLHASLIVRFAEPPAREKSQIASSHTPIPTSVTSLRIELRAPENESQEGGGHLVGR
jgi:hypothetical protein